jgi:hypothetical protein
MSPPPKGDLLGNGSITFLSMRAVGAKYTFVQTTQCELAERAVSTTSRKASETHPSWLNIAGKDSADSSAFGVKFAPAPLHVTGRYSDHGTLQAQCLDPVKTCLFLLLKN